MRYIFEEVKVQGKKSFKCSCGRRAKRSCWFYQTINPFNLHNGLPKTREQILIEIYRDKRLWEITNESCTHDRNGVTS
jgi:hypothetical protein